MSLERIIQHVKRQAQLLNDDWQGEKKTIIVQQINEPASVLPSSLCKMPELSARWKHIEHIYYVPSDAFLAMAYQQILGREADESGASYYSALLEQGMPRVFVVLALLASSEANPSVHLLGLNKLKPLWYLDKVLKKTPKLGPWLRSLFWSLLRRWEQGIGVKNQFLAQQLTGQQTQLTRFCQAQLSFSEQVSNQLNTLVQQAITSQTLAVDTLKNFQGLQHRLNYQQRMLQGVMDDLTKPENRLHNESVAQVHAQDALDAYYVAFEDANRGTREEIRAKHQPYLQLIAKQLQTYPQLSTLPSLDVGCGRGEWLTLLTEQGLLATGVDMNPIMVQTCQAQQLQAHHADALSWLKAQPDNSHSVISGFHIIEHLPFEVLFNLFAEAYRVLAPYGMIIFETPNPENILVASHTFYHDFTHRNPITPTAIRFLAQYHNFADIDILRLHPYPDDARVPGHDALTERVNGHLTGPQDFAILATKPDVSAGV